jgi:PST family polysaccharide transporter
MEEQALRGIPWTIMAFGVYKVVTFGTTIVLARLLVPADFGLMALAILAIGVLNVFSDFGFGAAQVIRQDLDRHAQGTILTVTVAVAAVVAAASAAGAPVAATIFHEPRVTAVLIVLAVHTVPTATGWFYETLLQRELQFRARFIARLVESLTWAAVSIVLAVLGAGVWSLVIGHIASTTVYATALVLLAPYRIRPRFEPAVARDVFRTGRGFVAQGGSAFLRENIDTFAVGRLGALQLGYYSVAFRLGELPQAAIAIPVAQVTFPGFARLRARGEDVGKPFLGVLRAVALVTFPVGLVLSATAQPFVRLFYGDKWLPMVAPLAVLALWAAVRPIEVTTAWLLNSFGEAGAIGTLSLLLLLPLVPTVLVAAHVGGIRAVAWVMVGQLMVSLGAMTVLASRRVGVPVLDQWRAVRPMAIAAGLAWAVASIVVRGTAHASRVVALGAPVALAVLAYLVAIRLLDHHVLRQVLAQGRRALRPAAARTEAAATTPDR